MDRKRRRTQSASGRAVKTARREHVVRNERWRELNLKLWELAAYSPEVAGLVLPPLAAHKVPDIRAGALCGLIQIRQVPRHIKLYRNASRDRSGIVRDAGVWGLSQSIALSDEKTLWQALWEDPFLEIQFSAAYALREMPRRIDVKRYELAVNSHPVYGVRLELAERSFGDVRLRAIARSAMRELLPELEKAKLLTPETRETLARLGVLKKAGKSR